MKHDENSLGKRWCHPASECIATSLIQLSRSAPAAISVAVTPGSSISRLR